MSEEIPPRVRQQIMRVQQVRESLQYVSALLLQVKQQLNETNNALKELNELTGKTVIYQAAGSLLFRTTKAKASKTLEEQAESLSVRVKSLEKQEAQLRKQHETLQETLRGMLDTSGGPAPAA